jgi:hypothetical protein
MQFAIGMIVLECSFAKHSHGPLGINFNKGLTMFSKELLKFALQVQREKTRKKIFPSISNHRILFYNIKNIYRFF